MISNSITDNTHGMNNTTNCIYMCIQHIHTYVTHVSNWCFVTHILPGNYIIGGDVAGIVATMYASKTIGTCTFVTKP